MGNRVASELVSSLRLSTLGTTLSSRSGERAPAMVDISSFPGVAKAFVKFNGDVNVSVNAPVTILRSYNISSVIYLGRGQYKVIFSNDFLNYNLGVNYIVTGAVQTNTGFLTAANSFYLQNDEDFNLAITLSSFRIFTVNTTVSAVTATNARGVHLTIF